MEDYLKAPVTNASLPKISRSRNVVTSLGNCGNKSTKYYQRKVIRSRSEQPDLFKPGDSLVEKQERREVYTNKHCSPIPPSTTPFPHHESTINEVDAQDIKVPWKEFLAQLNQPEKKKGVSLRNGWDDVKMIEYKYSRCHNYTPSQFHEPAPSPVSVLSPAHYSTSPVRPHRLKPILPNYKSKKRKKTSSNFLDVSGNGLGSQLKQKPLYRDYNPGLVKIHNQDCYRCICRMSSHDQHFKTELFNSACRVRKPTTNLRTGNVLESLICVNKSEECRIPYYETKQELSDSRKTMILRSASENNPKTPENVLQAEHEKDDKPRTTKAAKKKRRVLRPGRLFEQRRNDENKSKQLTSIFVTMPISIEFLKALELPQHLKIIKSLTLAIECTRDKKGKDNQKDDHQKDDVVVASSFTMVTQTESLTKIHQEQEEKRQSTFSIMDEAQNLFRPDSILSAHNDPQTVPLVVFSGTDTREKSGEQLNKNASANNELYPDPDTEQTGKSGNNTFVNGVPDFDILEAISSDNAPTNPNIETERGDISSSNQVDDTSCHLDPFITFPYCNQEKSDEVNMNTSAKDDEADNTSCYWISPSEAAHQAVFQKEQQSSDSGQQSDEQFFNPSEDINCRDDEDPDLEEDDDEGDEGFMFYKYKTYPHQLTLDNFVLPTGKALCYTAMTDKRYNKWSRQKRKGKKKGKKREKEEKSQTTPENSFAAMQEAYLKSIEAIYGHRGGVMKYKHDRTEKQREILKPNMVVISKPEIVPRTNDVTPQKSDTCSGSSEQTSSSTQCIAPSASVSGISGQQTSSCETKIDEDTDEEIKRLCTSSNSDQFETHVGRWGSPFKPLQTKSRTCRSRCATVSLDQRKLTSALEISRPFERIYGRRNGRCTTCEQAVPRETSSLQLITQRHPISQVSVDKLPSVAESIRAGEDAAGVTGVINPDKEEIEEETAKSPRSQISRVQKQILNYHRRDLLYSSSFLCPLSMNLPAMEARLLGTSHTVEVKSAPSKSTRISDRKKTSPGFIPRNYTALRSTDDPMAPGCRGKKVGGSPKRTKTKAVKRRNIMPEDTESITIHDLLHNLNTTDHHAVFRQEPVQTKSPCRDQTIKEIYGKSSCRIGMTRYSPDRRERDRCLSSLSISKSVTFSVLPLPDVFKIERYK